MHVHLAHPVEEPSGAEAGGSPSKVNDVCILIPVGLEVVGNSPLEPTQGGTRKSY